MKIDIAQEAEEDFRQTKGNYDCPIDKIIFLIMMSPDLLIVVLYLIQQFCILGAECQIQQH